MKHTIVLFLFICLSSIIYAEQLSTPLSFLENKGQLTDQYQQQRNDILYYGQTKGISFFLKEQGISYQIYQPLNKDSITIQRLDIDFEGINKTVSLSATDARTGYTNYYLPNNPDGILDVKSYAAIYYKEIYKGIDLKYYFKNGNVEYDYIVQPFANAAAICFKVKGITGITQNANGSLTLKTPIGDILEEKPIAYQDNMPVEAKWVVKDNILSYELGNYDASKPLIIDPLVRVWGTYFGGTGEDRARSNCINNDGSVFISGVTESVNNIATIGAFQTSLLGTRDCFVSKFDGLGNRLWATYYGGSDIEEYGKCSLDKSNHVYLFGSTASLDFPVTPGSYQTSLAGGMMDAFLVKLNTNGVRQYATYYGGNGGDIIHDVILDSLNNYYISGVTTSTNAMATAGTYQPIFGGSADIFISKFDSSLNRIWSTYYGGNDVEGYGNMIWGSDKKLYLFGGTRSSNGIATPNAFQTNYSGGGIAMDAYFVKFDTSGNRIWGTYYGLNSIDETAQTCLSNDSGFIYLMGQQGTSGFIAKFDTLGNNQWVNSYAGAILGSTFSSNGNLFICGGTSSSSGIGGVGSYQQFYSGNMDGFLAEVTPSGVKKWGTYYGGNGNNEGLQTISRSNNNEYYASGVTNSVNNISTVGSFQPVNGGVNDGILIKFSECSFNTVPILSPSDNDTICQGNALALSTQQLPNVSYLWSKNDTVIATIGNTFNATQAGSYMVTIMDNGCPSSSNTIQVAVLPVITPTISIYCTQIHVAIGQQVTINANVWNTGGYSYYINWYNHGVLFTTTTTPTVSFTKLIDRDSITAIITLNAPCTNPVTSNYSVVTGMNDIDKQPSFSVSPNPFSESFTITCPAAKGVITITDIMGREIPNLKIQIPNSSTSTTLSVQSLTIDMKGYAAGVYLLHYENEGQTETVKLVKE